MMISTRGRYAIRVMLDLAGQDSEAYVPLKEIAKRQEISEKYLENIIAALVKAEFVSGHRGKSGGYKLCYEPEKYTVGSILKLTEKSLTPVECLKGDCNPCSRAKDCPTLPMWTGLNQLVDDYLEGITLADLKNKKMQNKG